MVIFLTATASTLLPYLLEDIIIPTKLQDTPELMWSVLVF